jgi:hypothetical protein
MTHAVRIVAVVAVLAALVLCVPVRTEVAVHIQWRSISNVP